MENQQRLLAGRLKRTIPAANPGRSTTLIATTLSGEQGEVLLSKAIEMAEGGNVVMMKFLLERILPKERIVPITLPRLDSALDCINAMSAIAAAVSDGQITTREAAELTKVVDTFVRSIEITELEREAEILRRQLDPQKADLDSVRSHKGRGTGWPK